jgi:hypothetical protein
MTFGWYLLPVAGLLVLVVFRCRRANTKLERILAEEIGHRPRHSPAVFPTKV